MLYKKAFSKYSKIRKYQGDSMKICVFGAASATINQQYIDAVEKMGEYLALRGHSLVFGAGGRGLMGAAAKGFKKGGAYIHGVIPEFFKTGDISVVEPVFDRCDKVTYTNTMRERKAIMEDDADAFIIVPGGIGTFEELFEILTLKQLGRHSKPIAVYNVLGYYDFMEKMLDHAIDENFIRNEFKLLYHVFDDVEAMADYVESKGE